METKTYKLYDSLFRLGSLKIEDSIDILNVFKHLIASDFNSGLSAWEFLIEKYEKKISEKNHAEIILVEVYKLFKTKNILKCTKAVLETPALLKALFLDSESIYNDSVLEFAVNLITQSKFLQAHEVFKLLSKNILIDYGKVLKEIFEKYFDMLFLKSSDKKIIKTNKKTAEFFMTYISKIKGGDKALLTQRINEILGTPNKWITKK